MGKKSKPAGKSSRKKETKARAKGKPSRRLVWAWALGGGAALLLVVVVGVVIAGLLWPRAPEVVLEARALPVRGDPALLQGVESFPAEGRQHVPEGTPLEYGTSPPTSGPHYPSAASAGFYTRTLPYGNLVHSLEHGAVVIYYDPARLSPEAERSLKAFAQAHRNPWASVLVVPNPEPDPQAPYILTAWTVMLKLEEYDAKVVQAFLAEYLGRGPENRVR